MKGLEKEAHFMKEMILRKLVLDELDAQSLTRMLTRLESLNYAIGRLDGEKYTKGENCNEQNNNRRKINEKSRVTLHTKRSSSSKLYSSL